jgi:tetratricopeptide (TPR) repeat protein
MGELESYDTTLFFVCFFVPLIPLGKKRILEQCPYCRKHRLLPLEQWEESKKRDTADLLQRLHTAPDDKSVMLRAIQLSMAYQDPAMLDQLAEAAAETAGDDATVLGQLGFAYAYFARRESAVRAFEASLSLRDDPEIHRQLGLALLKLGRTDEAEPHLRPILAEREGQNAPLIYYLIEAYQAEGRHDKALELADERDAAFPELATDKLNKKQRAASQRHLTTGKRLKPVFLSESGQTGFREGNWTARLPLIIGPVVILGLLAWYLIAATVEGRSRRVYLVNGWDAPYTAVVNGEAYTVQPGPPKQIRVAEGEISVEVRNGNPGIQPLTVQIETPFFSRPFSHHTFVINPDELAVLSLEDIEYAQNPPPRKPGKLFAGEALRHFEGVEYEFTQPPQTVQVKHNQSVFKKLLELVPITADNRLFVAMRLPDQASQIRYGKHWSELDKANEGPLAWTVSLMSGEDSLTFLRSHLAERPPLISWHRAYQTQMGKVHPEVDLRPEYQKLIDETKVNPDCLYLLGRLEDNEESDRLFQQASTANPPSVYAIYAQGYDALCRGQFEDAVTRLEEARRQKPQLGALIQHWYREALMAAGRYDQLLVDLQTGPVSMEGRFVVRAERIRALAAKGDKEKARAAAQEMVQEFASQGDVRQVREALQKIAEVSICCAANDSAGFLKAMGYERTFETVFLEGKYADAAAFVGKGKNDSDMNQHGLLYLGLMKAGDQKAAQEQWQPFLDALQKEGRRGRQCADVLAGKRPVDMDHLRRLALEPRNKRVVLAVIAKRYPEQSKELLTLARKLDYHRDATSLCLQRVLE